MRKIRPFVSLLVPVLFLSLMWPQAQPKPAPSALLQATAHTTSSGGRTADYYRNTDWRMRSSASQTQGDGGIKR
jgi:hypothetical protein